MPDAVHPRALDDVAGHPPARVSLPSGTHAVDREGDRAIITDLSERDVRALATTYDLAVASVRINYTDTCEVVKSDGEVCGRDLPCQYHD